MKKLTFKTCLGLSLATGLVGLLLALPGRGAAQAGAAAGVTLGTLRGTYTFSVSGYSIDASGNQTPIAYAGRETYFGNGHATGVYTSTTKAGAQGPVSFTGTYTVNADGSVSETDTDANNVVTHTDAFPTPDGSIFAAIVTDPGVVATGFNTRGSGAPERY